MSNYEISREIIVDGEVMQKKITLTGIEMERIYNVVKRQKDESKVLTSLAERGYENWEEIPEALLDALVDVYQENEDDGKTSAINAVIAKHGEELEPYKEKWKLYEIEVTQTRRRTWSVRAKSDESADRIFEEWRETHIREFDFEMEDSEIVDEDIESAYETEGNPDYADITEEE